ncbi:MAG: heme-dependent oxidative N-demethylase family protein [Candidatus Puniceispirillaceae bacterium]
MTNITTSHGPAPAAPWAKMRQPLTMGLRASPQDRWLMADDAFDPCASSESQIALKQALHDTNHKDVFAAYDDASAAAKETYDLVRSFLNTHHQKQYDAQNALTLAEGLHPLEAAARSVPEDLLLLAPDRQGQMPVWHLRAASLCFPSHWALSDKMGRALAAIHDPVPELNQRLATPIDRFFDAMRPDIISHRRNWTLQIDNALFAPNRSESAPLTTDTVKDRLFVRVEHQSFRKLPLSGWVLFTIRTSMAPLCLWQDDPDSLQDLIICLDDMSAPMAAYRGMSSYIPPLKAWVSQRNAKK